ncbi:MAG: hypothetical protein ACH350_08610 [Parachlamydiaceae bacterium]
MSSVSHHTFKGNGVEQSSHLLNEYHPPEQSDKTRKTAEAARQMFEITNDEDLQTYQEVLNKFRFNLVKLETKITPKETENKIQSFFQKLFFPKAKLEEMKKLKEEKKLKRLQEEEYKKDLKECINTLHDSIESYQKNKTTQTISDPIIENRKVSKEGVEVEHSSPSSPHSIAHPFDEKKNPSSLEKKRPLMNNPSDAHSQLMAEIRQAKVEEILKKSQIQANLTAFPFVFDQKSLIEPAEKSGPIALENFTDEFTDHQGRLIATETAIRNPTVQRKINGLESKISRLEQEVEGLQDDPFASKEFITTRIERLKISIDEAKKELTTFTQEADETQASHGTTNTPRYRFQFIPHRDLATKKRAQLEEIANFASLDDLKELIKNLDEIEGLVKPSYLEGTSEQSYRKQIGKYLLQARDQFIPQYIEDFKAAKSVGTQVLINSQLQIVKATQGKKVVSSNGRSGAPSDFAHGEISLQELSDYQRLQLLKHQPLPIELENNTLIALYDLEKEGSLNEEKLADLLLMIKAKAILSYGGENIVKGEHRTLTMQNLWTGDHPLRSAMEKVAVKNELSSIPEEELALLKRELQHVDLDMDKLHQIEAKREQDIAKLFLQDLELHFENEPVAKSQTVYTRVGLLDLSKDAKNEYNSLFNERTQGLDILAGLNYLEGKQIVFDVEGEGGSFIHPDGTIHMPKRCSKEGVAQTTLSTVFLNVSVQGNVSNKGLQKSINEMGIKKLEELGVPQEEIAQINTMLKKISGSGISLTGDTNKTARQIIETVKKCLDSYASENCYGGKDRTGALLALLTKSALKEHFPEIYETQKKAWKLQLTREEGVMGQVAKANAGHTVVKTLAPNRALFGLRERMRHYQGAATLGQAAAKGIVSESVAPGQLFKKEEGKGDVLPKPILKDDNRLQSLEKEFANKVKAFAHLPGKNISTALICKRLSELNQIETQNDEQRALIDEKKLVLINLLREKASRNKQEAMNALKKLSDDNDPVMTRGRQQ